MSANPDFGASDTVAIPIPQQQGPQPGDNSTPGGVNTQNVPPANVIQHYPLGIPAFAPTISIQSLLKLIPPAAPTNLNVQLANCTINLSWQDNSANELGYNVWMTGFNMAPRIIAALDKIPGTGPTWVELAVPKPGEFSVWVEAVSALGGQPSNFQWLSVTSACPSQLPGKLLVEALDFTANSFYDRAYCYISFEGDPETRVPREKSQFVAVANGQGDIAPWASGDKKFVMSIPVDNALALEGECWGWAGNALSEIGRFSATSTPAEWDGRRLVSGENLEIVYRVTMGSPQEVTFADNPSILRPYDLKDLQVGYWPDIRDTREQEQQMNLDQRLIEWKWYCDPKTINEI
ncbi:MAG: hypothetical protein MUO77_14625 [Anaerolineales bacterium]|nr:hypothetical protein [Anaerolineales bacterium]